MSAYKRAKQRQMDQKLVLKLLNEYKPALKILFDRYAKGHTQKITLEATTKMLKDRSLLNMKKLAHLIPEITKAFHRSSFEFKAPDHVGNIDPHFLNFDEFCQCILRLSNCLLSNKKKQKYTLQSTRLAYLFSRLNLKSLHGNTAADNNNNKSKKKEHNKHELLNHQEELALGLANGDVSGHFQTHAHELGLDMDYHFTEEQLDHDFDEFFQNGTYYV